MHDHDIWLFIGIEIMRFLAFSIVLLHFYWRITDIEYSQQNRILGKFLEVNELNLRYINHANDEQSKFARYINQSGKITAQLIKKAWNMPPSYVHNIEVLGEIGSVLPAHFQITNHDFFKECEDINEWARREFIEHLSEAPKTQRKYQRWLESVALNIYENTVQMKYQAFLKYCVK